MFFGRVVGPLRRNTILTPDPAVLATDRAAFSFRSSGHLADWFLRRFEASNLFPVYGLRSPWENFWSGIYHMIHARPYASPTLFHRDDLPPIPARR